MSEHLVATRPGTLYLRAMEPVVTRRDSRTAVLLVVAVGLLMQAGSALAVIVIDSVGVVQALWLRTALAAIILALARPRWLRLPPKEHRFALVGLTLSLMAMNLCFYEAISRAPVGVVVAIEFLGPLGVAIAGSRRLLDVLWAVAAGAGVVLLVEPGGSIGVDGLVFALLAAGFWAAFILFAKRTVSQVEPMRATLFMLVGASLVLTPIWLATGVQVAGQGKALLLGLAVAVLSSALPYFLELVAIKPRACLDLRCPAEHRAGHSGVHGLRHPFARTYVAGVAGHPGHRGGRGRRRLVQQQPPDGCSGCENGDSSQRKERVVKVEVDFPSHESIKACCRDLVFQIGLPPDLGGDPEAYGPFDLAAVGPRPLHRTPGAHVPRGTGYAHRGRGGHRTGRPGSRIAPSRHRLDGDQGAEGVPREVQRGHRARRRAVPHQGLNWARSPSTRCRWCWSDGARPAMWAADRVWQTEPTYTESPSGGRGLSAGRTRTVSRNGGHIGACG